VKTFFIRHVLCFANAASNLFFEVCPFWPSCVPWRKKNMGCAQSSAKNSAPVSTGSKAKASRRDSVAVTKARMEKGKGRKKENLPPGVQVEVFE
jgi:hypothetical protein